MIMMVVSVADSRGNPSADLVRDLLVLIFTLLLFHLPAHLLGHLPGHLLVHVLALVMGLDLAGAGDDDPHHVVALALPFVLTVLAVCIGALLLSDLHILSSVLHITHLLPHSCAFLLINLLTLFSVYWLAHSLIHRLAVGYPLGDAGVALYLLVLGLIHGFVLSPALLMITLPAIFSRSSSSKANTGK